MKKKISIVLALLGVLIIFGFLTYKEEVSYSKYAKIIVFNRVHNFGVAKAGDTISYEYKIKNISNEPFTITNVTSDKDVLFKKTRIKKIIDSIQETSIYVQFVPETKGRVKRIIKVESNSSAGLINLELKGVVK